MVPDHWSNDAMVSMDRCGLIKCINVVCQIYSDSFFIVELFMICNKLMMIKKFTSGLGMNVSWLVMLIINQLAGLLM